MTPAEKTDLRSRIKYEQPMIDSRHGHVLWYGGDVLSLTTPDGSVALTLRANGDVVCELVEADGHESARVRDKSCNGDFAHAMSGLIASDAELAGLLIAGDQEHEGTKRLCVTDSNWWEVFVDSRKDGVDSTSYVLDAQDYDAAIDEMIELYPEAVGMPAVYVYHQYRDDQAYGSQEIKVFSDQTAGRGWLRFKAETYFGTNWDGICQMADEDDTVDPDYVSVSDGNGCAFFILERQTVN